MPESSKEEGKTTNLSNKRGRETSQITSSAAQRFFYRHQIRTLLLSSVEIQCNTDIKSFVARFNKQSPVHAN